MGGRPPGKTLEDQEHESLIEQRVQRERPCRTLFIRNIAVSKPTLQKSRHSLESHPRSLLAPISTTRPRPRSSDSSRTLARSRRSSTSSATEA